MTVNPARPPPSTDQLSPDLTEKLQHAYLGTFRGPTATLRTPMSTPPTPER